MTDKSIFSKILDNEVSGYKFFEDEDFFAILDIFPKTKGHSLLITKKPFKDIFEVPDDLASKITPLSKKIASMLASTFGATGFKFVQNNTSLAGQVVLHYHLHIIPFYDHEVQGKDDFENNLKQLKKEFEK